MKEIWFIRHAESSANKGGVSRPNAEITLTDEGLKQAELVAKNWHSSPSSIFVSEYQRTHQTALPLAQKYQISPTVIAGLNEFNTFSFELVQGMTGQGRLPLTLNYWRAADPDKRCGQDAQTFNEFCDQVRSATQVVKSLPDNSVIFGHGMWFAVFAWQLMGYGQEKESNLTMSQFFKFKRGLFMPNAGIYQLVVCGDSVAIQYQKNIKPEIK